MSIALILQGHLGIIYLPSCLFLFFIAKKCNVQPFWLAWVPALNLYLLCKIANYPSFLSHFMGCFFILFFFPFLGLGIIAYLGFDILWARTWWKVAELRRAPKWFGVFSILPFANIILFAYLAFKR